VKILPGQLKKLIIFYKSELSSFFGIIIIFLICIALAWGIGSFVSPNNKAVELLQNIAETEAEQITHLPKGSLKDTVDSLFPQKEKDK